MVRRIRVCSSCKGRYVSSSSALNVEYRCPACRPKDSKKKDNPNNGTDIASGGMKKTINSTIAATAATSPLSSIVQSCHKNPAACASPLAAAIAATTRAAIVLHHVQTKSGLDIPQEEGDYSYDMKQKENNPCINSNVDTTTMTTSKRTPVTIQQQQQRSINPYNNPKQSAPLHHHQQRLTSQQLKPQPMSQLPLLLDHSSSLSCPFGSATPLQSIKSTVVTHNTMKPPALPPLDAPPQKEKQPHIQHVPLQPPTTVQTTSVSGSITCSISLEQKKSNNKHNSNKNKNTNTTTNNKDICFICGCSLVQKFKNDLAKRLTHMKRCAKKHGVTPKDIKLNKDEEEFVQEEEGDQKSSSNTHNDTANNNSSNISNNNTTYNDKTITNDGPTNNDDNNKNVKVFDGWHGNAHVDLVNDTTAVEEDEQRLIYLRNQDNDKEDCNDQADDTNRHKRSMPNTSMATTTTTTTTTAVAKQTTVNQFFQAPVRSLEKVLLAGAKRVAKTTQILQHNTTIQQNQQGKKRKRGFWNKSKNRGPCPSYKMIAGTDFCVDGFYYAKATLTTNYFLTHFHSDHYGGITKQWNAGIIYCSLPTANLLKEQLGVNPKYIHPLPMGTPTVLESGGGTTTPGIKKPVTVTLLDANHCPGAVMFLFQTNGGKRHILHVGDFRWNRQYMVTNTTTIPANSPCLKDYASLRCRLDTLYLDTTYCDEKYTLPTQEEAIEATIQIVQQELYPSQKQKQQEQKQTTLLGNDTTATTATANSTLFVFGAYTIGKERIYLSVAEHFHQKVYVDTRRYKILSALNWPKERMALLTTNRNETNFWVVPLGHVNFKGLGPYLTQAKDSQKAFTKPYTRIVGFRPTGWSLTNGKKKKGDSSSSIVTSRSSGNIAVHGVPYSEHSSFPELVDCIECLKPKKIIPTVSVSKSEEQVNLLLKAVKEQQQKQQEEPIDNVEYENNHE